MSEQISGHVPDPRKMGLGADIENRLEGVEADHSLKNRAETAIGQRRKALAGNTQASLREVGMPDPSSLSQTAGSLWELVSAVPKLVASSPRALKFFLNLRRQVDVQEVNYESDGKRLPATVILPKDTDAKGTIVFSMGVEADRAEYTAFLSAIAKQGYNVLCPATRAISEGDFTKSLTDGDVKDLAAAIGYATKQGWWTGNYILGGASMGAARALILSARALGKGEMKIPKPQAILSYGAFSDMASEYRHLESLAKTSKVRVPRFVGAYIRKGKDLNLTPYAVPDVFRKMSPVNYIADIPAEIPLLLHHGKADRIVRRENAVELAGKREGTEILLVPGGGIHTTKDILRKGYLYKLNPFKVPWGEFKQALWYFLDDINDLTGLILTTADIDRRLKTR